MSIPIPTEMADQELNSAAGTSNQGGDAAINRGENHNDDRDKPNQQNNGASSVDIFKEICGITDNEIASRLLLESGGDVEAAVHQFFYANENPEIRENPDIDDPHGDDGLRHRFIPENRAPVLDPISGQNVQNQVIQRRAPPTNWGQWIRALVLLPFRFLYSTLTEFLTFFYNILVGPPNRPGITAGTRQVLREQQRPQPNNVIIEDRIIMRAQQDEYNQALAIDRQKAQDRRVVEQQRREEEQKEREEEQQIQARKTRLEQMRKEIATKAQQYDEQLAATAEQQQHDIVRIRISFPSGTKVERRFHKDDSLERLFDAVFVHPECPGNFSLLTSYPSTLLRCAPEWYRKEFEKEEQPSSPAVETFAESGLHTSAVIIVQDDEA